MENKELKAALTHVIGILNRDYSQFDRYTSGRFHLFMPTLPSRQGVYLGHLGEGWFVYLVHHCGGSLELRTDEGHIEITNYFEDPFNPMDTEVNLFRLLFPLASSSIIKARKELLKMEDKPNE